METIDNTTYSVDYLLDRVYDGIDKLQGSSKFNKFLITKPDVVFSNKKTFVRNFAEICKNLDRSEGEIKSFFESELNAAITIDANNMLIISGRYNQSGIENVVTNYVKQYKRCSECKSLDTEIIKENRITFIRCKKCYSRKSIL